MLVVVVIVGDGGVPVAAVDQSGEDAAAAAAAAASDTSCRKSMREMVAIVGGDGAKDDTPVTPVPLPPLWDAGTKTRARVVQRQCGGDVEGERRGRQR